MTWCLPWSSIHDFSSNKTTHYLLDHGDFVERISQKKYFHFDGWPRVWTEALHLTSQHTYLLTYLIGHKNPINGFRPAATHSYRRFCFLRVYASWLHQSMTGLPRFGPSNGYKVILFADFRRYPHQKPVSPEHLPPYERHFRANTLSALNTSMWISAGSIRIILGNCFLLPSWYNFHRQFHRNFE